MPMRRSRLLSIAGLEEPVSEGEVVSVVLSVGVDA